MEQYIPKAALLAKINKRIMETPIDCYGHQRVWAYNDVKSILDTIEVKEVDIEKEFRSFLDDIEGMPRMWHSDEQLELGLDIAKHFFELGLQASNPLTWEDVKEICVQSVLVEIDLGGKISDERHYTEVLKRFKAQKGE